MIIDDDQRAVMEFIATVNRVGYRPTAREINEWRRCPDRKPGRRGKLLEPEVVGTPDTQVRVGGSTVMDTVNSVIARQNAGLAGLGGLTAAQIAGLNVSKIAGLNPNAVSIAARYFAKQNALLGARYRTIPGTPGKPATYGPDRPREKYLDHLFRLGWLEATERDSVKRYSVTTLGSALLEADVEQPERGNSSVIVLAQGDELAYAQVLSTITDCENALVVDGYLTPDALHDIVNHTDATRFLINHKYKPKNVTALAVMMGTSLPNKDGVVREMRQADYHDRYLVGDNVIYSLTGSLNGLGKNSALLLELPKTPARAVREEIEDVWTSATFVGRGRSSDDHATADPKPARAITHDADGSYRHEGCTMRHTNRRTARNCRKGP